MAQYEPLTVLIELRDSSNPARKLQTLKILKNELVGHDGKKQDCITHGIVPVLSHCLSARNGQDGKHAYRDPCGQPKQPDRSEASAEDNAIRLEAVLLTGLLAQGDLRLPCSGEDGTDNLGLVQEEQHLSSQSSKATCSQSCYHFSHPQPRHDASSLLF